MKRIHLKGISIVLISLSSNLALGSDCITLSKYERYESHEFIALVDIKKVGEDYFDAYVFESFKIEGGQKPDLIRGRIHRYSIKPKEGETWLLYGRLENDTLDFDLCSGSKNFSYPIEIHNIPAEPPKFDLKEETILILEELLSSNLKNELYFEIQSLRQWSKEASEEEISKPESIKEIERETPFVFYLLSVFVLISIILNLIVIKKLKLPR